MEVEVKIEIEMEPESSDEEVSEWNDSSCNSNLVIYWTIFNSCNAWIGCVINFFFDVLEFAILDFHHYKHFSFPFQMILLILISFLPCFLQII